MRVGERSWERASAQPAFTMCASVCVGVSKFTTRKQFRLFTMFVRGWALKEIHKWEQDRLLKRRGGGRGANCPWLPEIKSCRVLTPPHHTLTAAILCQWQRRRRQRRNWRSLYISHFAVARRRRDVCMSSSCPIVGHYLLTIWCFFWFVECVISCTYFLRL